MDEKIFLIINLSFFGDVLLTNALCQNLKIDYPNSKIIFIVNKPFYEAAFYQYGVDEVYEFDKKGENKGVLGFFKFLNTFPEKYKHKIDAAFIIYANERGILLSYLLGSKQRISGPRNLDFLLTDVYKNNLPDRTYMQDADMDLLIPYIKKIPQILPIRYDWQRVNDSFADELKEKYKNEEVIGLCAVSKKVEKDIPVNTAVDIVKRLIKDNKTVFFFGNGDRTVEYSKKLSELLTIDEKAKFINLTNKTSIGALAVLLKFCKGLISIDTGTMHLACAVRCPVCAIFYQTYMLQRWAPRKELYNSVVITENYSADNIVENLYKIIN